MIGSKIFSALITSLLMIMLYSAYDGFGIGIFLECTYFQLFLSMGYLLLFYRTSLLKG